MLSSHHVLACVAFLPVALGKLGFQLYPLIQSQPMAEMLGISETCLAALNTTLPCDEDIFKWTVNVDDIYWTEQDAATLCVPDCTSSARSWTEAVSSACSGDWLVVGDRAVPAETLSLRFVEGMEIACLRDTKEQWCLPHSYNWTGSDVVQVDCAANPTDPWCINPANVSSENSRISSLYEDDLLCSECFLNLLYRRVTSEFLPNTDHSDYLVAEFQDIQSVCQTSVGPLATRAVAVYPFASEFNETAPEPTSTPEVDTDPWNPGPDDHPGFDVELPEEVLDMNNAEPLPEQEPFVPTNCTARAVDVRPASGEGIDACNVLAETYNVATGQLMFETNAEDCYSFDFVCVPEACELLRVNAGDTCTSIADAISNTTQPVTVTQLMSWNPNIMGACDFLTESQYICISRPGGSWVKPADEDLPENSNGPIRGGPGSTELLPIIDDPSTVPADRVQEGIAADCSRYIKAEITTASCWKIANDAQITQNRLFELNPVLGASGEHCTSQIWLGYYYCVGTKGDGTGTPNPTTTQSAPAATSTSPSVPKPTPQHEGTISTCNKWVQAVSGSGCWQLATDAGIDTSLFYQYNPVLGAAGENCGTKIWPDYYYCVGVSSESGGSPTSAAAPPATTTAPAKPTATQAGIPANCSKFVQALAGASCWQLANDNGIDMSVLFALNPVLGPQGENCGTQIWPNYFYCIATS